MYTSENTWTVTWDGSLYGQRGTPGEEITIGKTFSWGNAYWHIPAIYRFPEGIIIDFCIEVAPEPVRAFIDKWDLLHEEQHRYTAVQRQQIEDEHPLHFDFSAELHLNGTIIPRKSSSSQSWISAECLEMDIPYECEQKDLLDHYHLDPASCWSFHRVKFPHKDGGDLHGLALHLSVRPTKLPAETIANPKPGDIYHLTHPLTGKPYTLSVCEVEQKAIDPSHLPDELEYPTHFTAMTFTLSPDLPDEAFSLRDSKEGDAARRKDGKTGSAASVGIIGGAVSPVLMVRQPKDEPRLHSACSALRFEEVPVTWQFCFREKLLEDVSIDLL